MRLLVNDLNCKSVISLWSHVQMIYSPGKKEIRIISYCNFHTSIIMHMSEIIENGNNNLVLCHVLFNVKCHNDLEYYALFFIKFCPQPQRCILCSASCSLHGCCCVLRLHLKCLWTKTMIGVVVVDCCGVWLNCHWCHTLQYLFQPVTTTQGLEQNVCTVAMLSQSVMVQKGTFHSVPTKTQVSQQVL